MVKTNEGCLADMVVKPKDSHENKWLKLQLKCVSQASSGIYSFRITNDYTGCLIVLMCVKDNKLWLMKYD